MQYEKPELIAVGPALALVLDIQSTGEPDNGVEPRDHRPLFCAGFED